MIVFLCMMRLVIRNFNDIVEIIAIKKLFNINDEKYHSVLYDNVHIFELIKDNILN